MKAVTMNISLPEALKAYVDTQVTSNHYSGTSEYVRELVRRDQMDKQRAETQIQALRELIIEAMDSPETGNLDDKYFDEMRKKLILRAQEKQHAKAVGSNFKMTHK